MSKKMHLTAILVLIAFVAGIATPLILRGQAAPAPGTAGAEDPTLQTARRYYAPFIRAIVTRRPNIAQQIFRVHRQAQMSLESGQVQEILGRFQRPDRFDLNLIGGRNLGQNTGILLFTIATEEGPVAFKLYYYSFGAVNASGNNIHVSRIDITDDWDEIEGMTTNLLMLSAPVTVSLSGIIDEGPAGGM